MLGQSFNRTNTYQYAYFTNTGMDADVGAVRRVLNRALLTREEFALGVEAWQEWEDKVSPRAVDHLRLHLR